MGDLIRPLDQVVKRHYEWATSGSGGRIPLGFPFFDQATSGGPARGEVVMFLARSGVGKTWWVLNVVNNNPTVPTLVASLEMQDNFMLQRLAAIHMTVPTAQIEDTIRQSGSSEDLERTVQDFPLLEITDKPQMTLKDMSRAVREFEDLHGVKPELVCADYMELIKAGMAMSSLEQIDAVSRAAKNWAREEEVAFVILHQTNMNPDARVGGHRELDNGHLPLTRMAARFGGDVAADYTIAMFKPSLDPSMTDIARLARENEVWLQLLKNRGGSRLYEGGVQHHVDIATWRITPHQRMETR